MVAIKKNEKFLRERCGMNFPPSRFAGSWEMPVLKRVPSSFIPPTRFVDFEKALPLLDYEAGVHFYLDDYRFDDKIWIHPEKFIEKLKPYSCVLTPDFSMFLNMPRAFEPCNVYRSRCLGSLFQSAGITVVPSLQWSDEFSFAYCFDGLPKNSVVSISSVGTMKKKYALKNFRAGLEEALKRLTPETILFYGSIPKGCDFGNAKVFQYNNSHYQYLNAKRKEARLGQ